MKEVNKNKVFIVAELSANHNQDKQLAIATIKAARQAGADAVKLQTYTADTMTIDCDNDCFRISGGTLWDGRTLYELYKEAYTPWEWHQELFELCHKEGLVCFSTPFDKTAVDFLETLNNPIYKIASFEITDIPLIRYVARLGKKIILSSGIATLEDIGNAVDACREEGNDDIVILKCTSSYPAPLNEANLLAIPELKKQFGVQVGLSDHTLGDIAAITSVALGASIIEKHFILDRKNGGPDSAFSMEPDELKEMVGKIREVESALGDGSLKPSAGSLKGRKFSRSLFVVQNIKKGEVFTEKNVRSIRPGDGMPPARLQDIIGKKANSDISRGTPLKDDLIG